MNLLKTHSRLLLTLLGLLACLTTMAQEQQSLVVVINHDYTYSDPRWEQPVTLKKGAAITVVDTDGDYYQYWPYPAADVAISKSVTHIPGTAAGERCLVVKTAGAHFLEKPSKRSRVLCYNIGSSASVYHIQYVNLSRKPKEDDYGLQADWSPMSVPCGTKIPYKGKKGAYYLTEINGHKLYISAQQATRQ